GERIQIHELTTHMTFPGAVFALAPKRPELKQNTRADDSTELPRGSTNERPLPLTALGADVGTCRVHRLFVLSSCDVAKTAVDSGPRTRRLIPSGPVALNGAIKMKNEQPSRLHGMC